jgi:hypothetical protein
MSAEPSPERGASRRPLELALVAALVLLGSWLRAKDLTAFWPSPDEGNYAQSARLDAVAREEGLGEAFAQDAAWARELARDFSRAEDKSSYPHSYLHQWTMRWLKRAGAGYLASVRLPSALLGALFAPLLYLLLRRRGLPGAALVAAAIGALAPVFVWYARTGWGQTGCTFFWLAFLGLGWRQLDPAREPSARERARLAAGLALASLLAYGWHEMIVVHVAALGLAALLAPLWGAGGREGGCLRRALTSPRLWTVVVAALPAAALVAALALLNPWAQETWLKSDLAADLWTRLRLGPRYLFAVRELHLQITWPVLALAALGVPALWRRERAFASYLLVSLLGGTLPYLLLYNYPHLERIYLPAIAILALFAGEGAGWIGARIPAAGRGLRPLAALALAAWLFAVSWASSFAPLDHPLLIRGLYPQKDGAVLEARHSEEPMHAVLRSELAPDEPVGVHTVFEQRFELLDAGLPARMFSFDQPRERWPRFLVGEISLLEGEMNARFGAAHPYARVAAEKAGGAALYRRVD